MTELTDALFRIDPTEGLLEYVQSIKPYHSKVLDVFVEYIYSETSTARVDDRLSWTLSFDQSCAYMPIVSVSSGANTITVSLQPINSTPRLYVGMTISLAFNRYRPASDTFTVTAITTNSTNQTATLTLLEPLSIESSKPPADRLTPSQVNSYIGTGSVAVQCPDRKPVTYTCGFGYVWDPYSSIDLPSASIIEALGPIKQSASVSNGSAVITLGAHPSNHVYTVGEVVNLTTDGTFPSTTSGAIVQGTNFYVVIGGSTTIQVSRTEGGTPVVFSSTGVGQLYVNPYNQQYNSFLVDGGSPTPFTAVVKSLTSNQFVFAHRFTITGRNTTTNTWSVSGNLVSGPTTVAVGDKIYVNSNTDASSNREYTVTAVSVNGALTVTTITVFEPISIAAAVNGRLYVPFKPDEVPYWPAGSAVNLNATVVTSSLNLYPAPTAPTTTYYFTPTPTIGVFNLSTKRFPTQYEDIVDLTALGTGSLTVTRVEPFVPGEPVTVNASAGELNDGTYIIQSITPEGSNFRVRVYQRVPISDGPGGTMSYYGSFGSPYCAVADAPALHTETFIHEKLVFDFGDDTDTGGNENIPPYDVAPFL